MEDQISPERKDHIDQIVRRYLQAPRREHPISTPEDLYDDSLGLPR